MPKDKNGADVQTGETVWIECLVEWVHDQEHGANLNLRTVEQSPEGHYGYFGLSAKQVRKAAP